MKIDNQFYVDGINYLCNRIIHMWKTLNNKINLLGTCHNIDHKKQGNKYSSEKKQATFLTYDEDLNAYTHDKLILFRSGNSVVKAIEFQL